MRPLSTHTPPCGPGLVCRSRERGEKRRSDQSDISYHRESRLKLGGGLLFGRPLTPQQACAADALSHTHSRGSSPSFQEVRLTVSKRSECLVQASFLVLWYVDTASDTNIHFKRCSRPPHRCPPSPAKGHSTSRRHSGITSGLVPAKARELESGVVMGWCGYRGPRVGVGRAGGGDVTNHRKPEPGPGFLGWRPPVQEDF